MSDAPRPASPVSDRSRDGRLDSWKEIAAYMRRDVTTVQRWEKREGMPVRRHVHDKIGSVYAYTTELDTWARTRNTTTAGETFNPSEAERPTGEPIVEVDSAESSEVATESIHVMPTPSRRVAGRLALVAALVIGAAVVSWSIHDQPTATPNPLAGAQFVQLTDFGGREQAAAISRDGRFAAFLSDRDQRMDVWITQIGTGRFYNLTGGAMGELENPSVRTLGFSPDSADVTFWARRSDGTAAPEISVWAVPVLGGRPRPYLEGAAEFDWSGDGTALVYHTPGAGDPMFVRRTEQAEATQIFSAPAGLHSHFPVWSPDQAFIYFVQGAIPDRLDIWRIAPTGGVAERMTSHDSYVSHPVFLDDRTLLYLATDDDSGPWLHRLDLASRQSSRVSQGIERYTSLAAGAGSGRLVATVARPRGVLWRVALTTRGADMSTAHRVPLTTSSGSSPRLSRNYLLYVSATGERDSIWKILEGTATELWSAPRTQILGAPAIARDGRQIAFSTRNDGRQVLYIANADGTNVRALTDSLDLHGGPSFAVDGRSLAVAAIVAGTPRVFTVPLDGRPPSLLVDQHAADPIWSPDGGRLIFSGPDVGTTFPLHVADAHGSPQETPRLTLTRGARHVAFVDGERSLIVLRGEIRHKNLWAINLDTGAEQRLTDLAPDFHVRDFDVSPDGRELVIEQEREHSDVILIEVAPSDMARTAERGRVGEQVGSEGITPLTQTCLDGERPRWSAMGADTAARPRYPHDCQAWLWECSIRSLRGSRRRPSVTGSSNPPRSSPFPGCWRRTPSVSVSSPA